MWMAPSGPDSWPQFGTCRHHGGVVTSEAGVGWWAIQGAGAVTETGAGPGADV